MKPASIELKVVEISCGTQKEESCSFFRELTYTSLLALLFLHVPLTLFPSVLLFLELSFYASLLLSVQTNRSGAAAFEDC